MPASGAAPKPLFTYEDVFNKIDVIMTIACGLRCRYGDEVQGLCCWALWARVVEGVGAEGSWRVVTSSIGLRKSVLRVPPRSPNSSVFGEPQPRRWYE